MHACCAINVSQTVGILLAQVDAWATAVGEQLATMKRRDASPSELVERTRLGKTVLYSINSSALSNLSGWAGNAERLLLLSGLTEYLAASSQ